MPFEPDEAISLNRRLSSVEIFTPSQIQHPDGSFELYVSAYFGVIREDIPTAEGVRTLTIGLHSAILSVDTCENSRMEPTPRHRSAPLELRYESLRDEASKRSIQGKASGSFSMPLLQYLKVGAEAGAEGEASAANSAKTHQDTTFEVYECVEASPNEWRLQALNPARPKPHLDGAELRAEALCTIQTPEGRAEVTARIAIGASDLWLDAGPGPVGAPLEDEANRNAVLMALVAKSAEENAADVFSDDPEERELTIAQSTLHRRKAEDGS